ncbi:MAG: MBOAT family protein [Prevotellaceae bacterium]|jgi:D-alanyl-lipoteichoic acid acyltransferase DltB (MBOAT superfamily)|nr:MBOAT family protein [Prevotellaceae bacterium]
MWNNLLTYFNRFLTFGQDRVFLFTQFDFWVFFALVMLLLSFIGNRRLMRNAFLCAASLFFYYKTCGLFVLLLLFTTLSDFVLGQRIYRASTRRKKQLFLVLSICINLTLLFYFKYAYFFTDVYNNLFHSDNEVFNWFALWTNEIAGSHFTVERIILPVGISFYTFQTISYVVDIFRQKITPVKNLFDYGFYVGFFPQLVAGPIVRANEFIPQLYKPYFLTKKQFGIALFWILNGLVKKMILSDYLAVNFIDRVFANPLMYTGFENLMGLFVYSLQVYADFSGYTDIAIGTAMLMGFYLPRNFHSPYKATNPGNFWKRWHISLSKWLTDYLYIPMGGNRRATAATFLILGIIGLVVTLLSNSLWVTIAVCGTALLMAGIALFFPQTRHKITTNINIMNTMLLGGIWHGASWNFMIWGGLNGVGVVAFKFWRYFSLARKNAVVGVVFALFVLLNGLFDKPVFMIGVVWSGIFFFGTLAEGVWALLKRKPVMWLNRAWSVLMTFIFITFTRLFFRSGSNLDPAQANEVAWETAQNMVSKIGGTWEWGLITDIIAGQYKIFCLFALGMIIHWLSDRFKRRYRYAFATLPVGWQLLIATVTIFTIYQFATADLQAFIYFQF